jgi:GAF domain-containing protein
LAREVCQMPESFGARLRQRREQQQITLTSIAQQTKISVSLLEALERDDVSHWPAGIFRRAFIRAYAQAIGLDPGVVVGEFLELYPDPIEVVAPVSAMPPEVGGGGASSRPPTRFRYLVGSIASLFHVGPGVVQERICGREGVTAADRGPATAPSQTEPDLSAAARLCTELGRVSDTREAPPLLEAACRILDAVGLIVWVWDRQSSDLRPALAHGYSDTVLAHVPRVRRDADNATAAAFRSAYTCIVNGRDLVSGAVVVPLMTPAGCVGVLAVELQHGGEQRESVRALATIFAAHLAMLIGTPRLANAVNA